MTIEQSLSIAGGYGVVGEQIARALRRRHPRLPLTLAGRNPAKAEALAREYLLMDAARAVITYVDITRWTERLRSAASRVGTVTLQAPVMFASSWMAGVAAVVAVAASRPLKRVNSVDIAVLFSLKDKAGPNS
ncbi:MAG: saccharopine dehydrogenase, partial [Chloroflexota bacterium]